MSGSAADRRAQAARYRAASEGEARGDPNGPCECGYYGPMAKHPPLPPVQPMRSWKSLRGLTGSIGWDGRTVDPNGRAAAARGVKERKPRKFGRSRAYPIHLPGSRS